MYLNILIINEELTVTLLHPHALKKNDTLTNERTDGHADRHVFVCVVI